MKKKGFTLAEILIALVIIGVIAALTVPSLMQTTNGQEYKSALKKAISSLNQALTLNYALDGMNAHDYTSASDLADNVFRKRMSVMDSDDTETFPSSDCSGEVWTTADGMIFCINGNYTSAYDDDETSACNIENTNPCSSGAANIYIDVNGFRKPNVLTSSSKRPRDIYQAMIYAQKVLPYGDAAQQIMYDKDTTEDD